MATDINLEVSGKYIMLPAGKRAIVSCNEDYRLHFTFSSEWSGYTQKTILLSDGKKLYTAKTEDGTDECDMPRITVPHMYELGVIAGEGPELATVGLPILVIPSINTRACTAAENSGTPDIVSKLEGALAAAEEQLGRIDAATSAAESAAALAGDAADDIAAARDSAAHAATLASAAAGAANAAASNANDAADLANDAAALAGDAADAAAAASAREKLTFGGAVNAVYDGTAAVRVNIPTQPQTLPSPAALTITVGDRSVSYDGSQARSVTIDGTAAAAGASGGLETILDVTIQTAAGSFTATVGDDGAAFSLRHWVLYLMLPYASSGTGTWDSLSLHAPGSFGYDPSFEADLDNSFFIDHPCSDNASLRFEGDSDMSFGKIEYIRRVPNPDEPDEVSDATISTHPAMPTSPLTKVEIGQTDGYRPQEYGTSMIPAGTRIRLLGIRT